MPSKRKKNKRRMTRVQAQRRILEEQYAANPPAKASRGTAASVPAAAALQRAAKGAAPAPAPAKVPKAVTAVEVDMKGVAPQPEAVSAWEQSAAVAEARADVPDTGADAQKAISPAEAPTKAPVETEILTEETANVTTETEPTHEEEAEAPAEEVAPQEAEMEVAVTQAAAELVVTVHTTDRVAAVPEAEAAAEKLAEVVCGREVPEEEAEMEVLPAEEAAEVSAEDNEPITKTEDAPAQSMEIQVVTAASLGEAGAPGAELKEGIIESLADDFVVTETAEAVEVAIAKSARLSETVEMSETLNSQSGVLNEVVNEPVAKAAGSPAEETMEADLQECADAPREELKLEEPKLEVCEMPCQIQLESVEMPVESPRSGHVAPEVSTEG